MLDAYDVASTGEKQSIWIDSKEEDIRIADKSGSTNTNAMTNDFYKIKEPTNKTDDVTQTFAGHETLTRKTSTEADDSIEKNACIISHEVEQVGGIKSERTPMC
jgi:hypothetical protein